MSLPPFPSEDQPRDLPRPSGPSADLPPPPAPSPYGGPPPPTPYGSPYVSDPGTNGFAIAALVCGLAFFVPLAAILAIIFGIIALRQIARTFQRGRGMAIAGIVTGSLVVLAWVALIAVVIAAAPSVTTQVAGGTGGVTSGEVYVDELGAGDCFSGLKEHSADPVTAHPCGEPHQAQLITTITLDDGTFPGADKAADQAGNRCETAIEPLIRDVTEGLDLYFLSPETALDWRLDRSVQCVLVATDGEMTGSVLK